MRDISIVALEFFHHLTIQEFRRALEPLVLGGIMIVDVNVLLDIAESSGIDRLEKWGIPVHRKIEKKVPDPPKGPDPHGAYWKRLHL